MRNCWIALSIAGLVFLSGCTPYIKNATESAVAVDGIISKSGYYEDQNVGISLTWPTDVFSEPSENSVGSGEVVNVQNKNKIPVLSLAIVPVQELVMLADVGDFLKLRLKTAQPDSKRHKQLKNETIKLEGGRDANFSMIKWRYQGTTVLVTVYLTAFKDGNAIITAFSSIASGIPTNIQDILVKALNVK